MPKDNNPVSCRDELYRPPYGYWGFPITDKQAEDAGSVYSISNLKAEYDICAGNTVGPWVDDIKFHRGSDMDGYTWKIALEGAGKIVGIVNDVVDFSLNDEIGKAIKVFRTDSGEPIASQQKDLNFKMSCDNMEGVEFELDKGIKAIEQSFFWPTSPAVHFKEYKPIGSIDATGNNIKLKNLRTSNNGKCVASDVVSVEPGKSGAELRYLKYKKILVALSGVYGFVKLGLDLGQLSHAAKVRGEIGSRLTTKCKYLSADPHANLYACNRWVADDFNTKTTHCTIPVFDKKVEIYSTSNTVYALHGVRFHVKGDRPYWHVSEFSKSLSDIISTNNLFKTTQDNLGNEVNWNVLASVTLTLRDTAGCSTSTLSTSPTSSLPFNCTEDMLSVKLRGGGIHNNSYSDARCTTEHIHTRNFTGSDGNMVWRDFADIHIQLSCCAGKVAEDVIRDALGTQINNNSNWLLPYGNILGDIDTVCHSLT